MDTCPFTNQKINLQIPTPGQMMFYYETPMTGKVKITDIALASVDSLTSEEKHILVGICRNRTIKGEDPLIITYSLFSQLKTQSIPYTFEDKAKHLLQFLYDNGGKEYRSHDLNSDKDSPISYSSREDFENIIAYLLDNKWIDCENETRTKQCVIYQGLRITKNGIHEIVGNSNPNRLNIPELNDINDSIDKTEIKLRNIVVEVLIRQSQTEDFENFLTGEVKRQVKRRIEQHIEKHPNKTKDDFKSLRKSIQFCDIEHLKTTILKDEYWDWFKPVFQDKLKVEKYFNQFSEIRHVVKHTREMTSLILYEGKASIDWFEMIQFI